MPPILPLYCFVIWTGDVSLSWASVISLDHANVMIRHMSDEHRLFEPRTNSKLGERTFKYSAPSLYNNLPSEMKNIQEEEVYKRKLKTLLFGRSYDTEDLKIKPRYKI